MICAVVEADACGDTPKDSLDSWRGRDLIKQSIPSGRKLAPPTGKTSSCSSLTSLPCSASTRFIEENSSHFVLRGPQLACRSVATAPAKSLTPAFTQAQHSFAEVSSLINRMDLISRGPLRYPLRMTSLKESHALGKFVKFNLLPPSSFSSTNNVLTGTRRLQTIAAKVSSTDSPMKGKRKGGDRQEAANTKQEERTTNSVQVLKNTSNERDARVALLERSAAPGVVQKQNQVMAGQEIKHRGDLLLNKVEELVESKTGPPQWYCPVEADECPQNAPLFLCLPDIISNGLSLMLHQEKLARLFRLRCLHVPISDATSNKGLIMLVESAVKEELSLHPGRPIYLMGEGYGALLALSFAARNPDVDLVLVLVDPATWCDGETFMPRVITMLEATPGPVSSTLPFLFSTTLGDPVTIAKAIVNPSLPQREKSEQFVSALRDVVRVFAKASVVWSKETGQRKAKQLQMAARDAIGQMKNVKADVLLLSSGKEQNAKEARSVKEAIPSATIRYFKDRSAPLLLEEGVELASLIKATNMYRRSKPRNIVTDYVPPTEEEKAMFRRVHLDIMKQLFSPVFFTVNENGSVKRGVPRITKERPILFVCNHTFVGFDLGTIIGAFMDSQDVMIRSLAHPLITKDPPGEVLTPSGFADLAHLVGAVRVSGNNLYRLMAANEAVLLLPGGMREAVKRRGEAYKLIWPTKPEFVRTAIRHGAVIIPMAAVGGDDFIQILLEQHQTLQLPVIGEKLQNLGADMPRVREAKEGEEEEGHLLGTIGIPKPPPRMYFAFQKPIYTHELRDSLKDKEAVEGLYRRVKSELEAGLDYLLEKREDDPYQNFVPRVLYEKTWGRQAPTFKP